MKIEKSIKTINRTIIFSIFLLNFVFVMYAIKYISLFDVKFVMYFNIFINLFLVLIFSVINYKYENDYTNLLDTLRDVAEDRSIAKLPKSSFKENKKIESLIKKTYIRWNLLKKDFQDLKNVFEKFIPQDIYKKISFKWYERVTLGSCISKKVTIMFLDIMWFTRISENITPERSLLLLNIYFDWIGDIVYRRWWYIDKFLWDWIMILFEDEYCDNALMCAIEIQEFIKKFQVSTIGKHISIWIGINYWEVIMWTIGTKKRMDATVIWDNVNIASRLEWLTRKYSKSVIMSENTYNKIDDIEKFSIEEIWEEQLNWKEQSIKIFSMNEYYKVKI